MRSPLTIMTVYSVASRLPSLRSALRGLDTTSVHGQLKSWATARKPPAGALTKKTFRTQTRYSWCPRNRGNSGAAGLIMETASPLCKRCILAATGIGTAGRPELPEDRTTVALSSPSFRRMKCPSGFDL